MSTAFNSTAQHRLILMPSGRRGEVDAGRTLLEATGQLGVVLESICGGRQTCGKCLVSLEQGTFHKHAIDSLPEHLSPPDSAEQAYARKHNLDLTQQRLACAAQIQGDILLHIPESSLARKQIIRKSASDIAIEVKPAVQIYYVELTPPELSGRADAHRLRAALAEQWGLYDLSVDISVLRTLSNALRMADGAVTVTVWQGREIIRVEPGYVESLYGLAVDVGSTTIAGHLCDLRTGAVLATETLMNPQVRYGEDLISRISYAGQPDGTRKLHQAIIKALNELAENAAQSAGIDTQAITDSVLVGNTVMHHLLLGIDPTELGHLPFALTVDDAVDMSARDMGLRVLNTGAKAHILPCIAGYVGADNVGVLLAEQATLSDAVTLIVDIGTNAEILLCAGEHILSTSSPTGPAFEGAQIRHGQRAAVGAIERLRITETGGVHYKVIGDERWSHTLSPDENLSPTGICGSGIIEAVGELFNIGIIRPDGRFDPDAFYERLRFNGKQGEFVLAWADESATGEDILITQHDVRAIQLAKGALYSGVRLLMDCLGVDHVDHIRLAGAFGSYIDPVYAMILGLIPDCDLDHVTAIGNAAGDGARIALLNVDQRAMIQRLVGRIDYIETAADPRFQDYFVDALHLPHAIDTFPHLNRYRSNT